MGSHLVLGPLNLLEVDTLLNHFPQGAHLPQTVDMPRDELYGAVYFCLGGEAPNAKPDGRMSDVLLEAKRSGPKSP
jgi:hypothetical protein